MELGSFGIISIFGIEEQDIEDLDDMEGFGIISIFGIEELMVSVSESI